MRFFVFVLAMASSLVASHALTLEELNVSFRAAMLKQNETKDAEIEKLNKGYLKALSRIQESFQKAADLDRALLVKGEIEKVAEKVWPLPPLPESLKRKVGTARQTYLKGHISIQRKWASGVSKITGTMEKALKAKMTSLTKAGDLERAKKAQEMLNQISNDPVTAQSKALLERITTSGDSKAAFLLRRPGDNLEVLVRYDSSGKISMKSPVENVVEKTGGRKEKGETSAKTLGEFVGAPKFEVDSFVSYDESTAEGEIEFSDGYGVHHRKIMQFEGEKGLELKIAENAKNAFLNLNDVLPASDQPGTFKVSVGYFVPNENKTIKGLVLRHGGSKGKNIGSSLIEKGKWTEETHEGVSSNDESTFRIQFAGLDLGKMKEAWGDRVFVNRLKIEVISFSAFIVEEYGKSGEPLKQIYSEEKQVLLIKNGAFFKN